MNNSFQSTGTQAVRVTRNKQSNHKWLLQLTALIVPQMSRNPGVSSLSPELQRMFRAYFTIITFPFLLLEPQAQIIIMKAQCGSWVSRDETHESEGPLHLIRSHPENLSHSQASSLSDFHLPSRCLSKLSFYCSYHYVATLYGKLSFAIEEFVKIAI